MEPLPKKRKLYRYVCEECGRTIIAAGKKRIIKCDRCLKRARSKRSREQTNSTYRKYKYNAGIHADIKELTEYNKAHGTDYSYGQYKMLVYLGKI